MKKTLLAAASLAAALMLSTAASAAPTTFRLCTGGEAGANANDKPYEAVLRGFSDAKPSIMKLVEPK